MSLFIAEITPTSGICAGGTVVGWGDLVVPEGLTNVIAVGAGYSHGLALKADGTVAAWGTYWVSHPSYTNVPVTVPPGLTNVVAVSGGNCHSLALKADGTVVAWGVNSSGQLDVPPDLTNVVAIAAGGLHSLALKADGTAVGWGSYGSSVPTGLTDVVAIGAGSGSMALKADGSISVWGPWAWVSTNVPADLTNVVAVAGSYFGWLALKANGTVVDPFGEGISVLSGLTNIVAIAGSSGTDGHVNLALKADGTVVGWGYSGFTGPVPAGLSNVVAMAAGGYHNLALVETAPPVLQVPLKNPVPGANGFTVLVPTRSGRVYRLEYKTSLTDTRWTALPLVAGTGRILALADPDPPAEQRFYRVRQW